MIRLRIALLAACGLGALTPAAVSSQYVRTPAGWRIKARSFVPSRLGPRQP